MGSAPKARPTVNVGKLRVKHAPKTLEKETTKVHKTQSRVGLPTDKTWVYIYQCTKPDGLRERQRFEEPQSPITIMQLVDHRRWNTENKSVVP
jgi:hypothetical protein